QRASFMVTLDSRVLQFASICFDASASEIFVTLLSGATLVLATAEDLRPGLDLVSYLQQHSISHVTLTPSVLAAITDAGFQSVTTLVSAGEACTGAVAHMWAPGRTFLNAYGPTETSVCATIHRIELENCKGTVPIGRPIANVRIYILDANLEPVPIGVRGQIYIGGAGLARGYCNSPSLSAERFVPDP